MFLLLLVLVGNIDASILSTDIKPIHTLFRIYWRKNFWVCGRSCWGNNSYYQWQIQEFLASSRFPFAMGKDNLMPGFLGSVSSKIHDSSFSDN